MFRRKNRKTQLSSCTICDAVLHYCDATNLDHREEDEVYIWAILLPLITCERGALHSEVILIKAVAPVLSFFSASVRLNHVQLAALQHDRSSYTDLVKGQWSRQVHSLCVSSNHSYGNLQGEELCARVRGVCPSLCRRVSVTLRFTERTRREQTEPFRNVAEVRLNLFLIVPPSPSFCSRTCLL